MIAIVAGALALRQAGRADDEAAAAEAAATRADARRVSAQALVTPEVDRALLLAVEGARLDDSAETNANLLTVLTRQPVLPIANVPGDQQGPIDVGPDGDLLASIADGKLVLRDADTLGIVMTAADANGLGPPEEVAFSPGGGQLAVAFPDAVDSPVVLYDAQTLEPAAAQLGGVPETARLNSLAYSPDGRLLAASFIQLGPADVAALFAVVVWDMRDPAEPVLHIDTEGDVQSFANVAFSADGARLYVTTYPPGDTRAYDTATGEQVASSNGTGGFFAVSPEGSLVAASGLLDASVHLLDAETLAEIRLLSARSAALLHNPRFADDGTTLVAVGPDGSVYTWDLTTGDEAELIGDINASWRTSSLVVSPHDDIVYTSTEQALTAWDLHGGRSIIDRSTAHAEPAIDAEVALPVPGGQVAYIAGLATGYAPGGSVQLLDVASGHLGDVIDLGHVGSDCGRGAPTAPDSPPAARTAPSGCGTRQPARCSTNARSPTRPSPPACSTRPATPNCSSASSRATCT